MNKNVRGVCDGCGAKTDWCAIEFMAGSLIAVHVKDCTEAGSGEYSFEHKSAGTPVF